jgi:type IV secretion system protein TrbL
MTSPLPPGICIPGNVGCELGTAVKAVGSAVLGDFAAAISDAVGSVLSTLGSFWTATPTPAVSDAAGNATDTVGFLQGSLREYTLGLAVLSVIIGGTKMAWEQRAEPGKDMLRSLLTLSVVSGAGLLAVSLLVQSGDAFATWIIDASVAGGGFGQNMTRLLGAPVLGPLSVVLVILLGLAAILASIVQVAMMIARGGVLVILSGVLPTSAAATNTERGRAMFSRTVSWLLAFVLYKPAAAFVYAAAFRLAGSSPLSADGLVSVITGLILIVMSIFALPALMRLVTPMVSAVSASGGGGAAFGGAVAALPTGAMFIRGAGGSAGAAGAAGPTGAAMPAAAGASGAAGMPGAAGASGASGAAGAAGGMGAAGAAAGPWAAAATAASGAAKHTAERATDPTP